MGDGRGQQTMKDERRMELVERWEEQKALGDGMRVAFVCECTLSATEGVRRLMPYPCTPWCHMHTPDVLAVLGARLGARLFLLRALNCW